MHTVYVYSYVIFCPNVRRDFKYYIAMMFISKKVYTQDYIS